MVLQFVILFVSLFVLVKGSNWFIDSAEHIGLVVGIPSFVIGMTIVAFGTSLPELATSIASVLQNQSEVVVANVVGSNITNILLVFGAVAIFSKNKAIESKSMRMDISMMMIATVLFYFMVSDQNFTLFEAGVLFAGLIIFILQFFSPSDDEDVTKEKIVFQKIKIPLMILGAVMVFLGAKYTIESLMNISEMLNIGSEIIALSLVALGTSLPEVFVSAAAAMKGKTNMALGNVIGSNIFNIYAVMSIPRFVGNLIIPENLIQVHIPMMLGVTTLLAISCYGYRISKWQGFTFFLFYVYFIYSMI